MSVGYNAVDCDVDRLVVNIHVYIYICSMFQFLNPFLNYVQKRAKYKYLRLYFSPPIRGYLIRGLHFGRLNMKRPLKILLSLCPTFGPRDVPWSNTRLLHPSGSHDHDHHIRSFNGTD